MSDSWRLFIGLPLPPAPAARCEEWLAPHRAAHPEARWLPAEVLHVTLVFLGPVPPARVRLLCEAIGRVATRASPIHVELGQGGGRARRGDDGVAWLEVGRGATEITRLARSLEAAVGWRSGPHSAGELPHVTVARRASSRLIADLAGAGGAGASIGWRVDSVVLQRSHLGGAGARYEPVHVVPLGGSVASPGPTLLDGSASGS